MALWCVDFYVIGRCLRRTGAELRQDGDQLEMLVDGHDSVELATHLQTCAKIDVAIWLGLHDELGCTAHGHAKLDVAPQVAFRQQLP
jgi:hypothetical protein